MTLQEKYIKDTNQYEKYVKWLESQIINKPEDLTEDFTTTNDLILEIIDKFSGKHDYETLIDYNATDLSYQTQIIFPRLLTLNEKKEIEGIITYWSNIPYVSIEGNYGIEWGRISNYNFVTIFIDFTKSASDDYCSREILEKLAEWVWQGTPKRKHGDRKYEGIVKPFAVRADNV